MTSFKIPYPDTRAGRRQWTKEYTLNAIYSGKHHRARTYDSQVWHEMVWVMLHKQGIRKNVAQGPVKITFWWNDGLDLDNHAYIRKMVIDAMKGWLIADDTRKYVREINEKWHDENYILIELEEA